MAERAGFARMHAGRIARVPRTSAAAAVLALATALSAGTGTAAAQPVSTQIGLSCGSANPLLWAPPFTWNIGVTGTLASTPPGADHLQPAVGVVGDNDLPAPPSGLFPYLGTDWYGTRVVTEWRNRDTGATGRAVSVDDNFRQKPSIPQNAAFTGLGTIDVTVTIETGAVVAWFNPQRAVCTGTVLAVDGR